MPTYYDMLNLSPTATPLQVEMAYQRFVTRHRATIEVEQVFSDPRFQRYLNAYLTLSGPLRAQYDDELRRLNLYDIRKPPSDEAWGHLPEFFPLDDLSPLERHMMIARAALWRREMTSAVHLLRTILEKEPGFAPGWALLGETFLTLGRLNDGIYAYERAVEINPEDARYAARLQHARDVREDKVELVVDPSPEEQLLREERRARLVKTTIFFAMGLLLITLAFNSAFLETSHFTLFVAWQAVALQAVGFSIIFWSLASGSIIGTFEHILVTSTLPVYERHRYNQYPYGLLLLTTSIASIWLSVLGIIIVGLMDDDWPLTPGIMVGLCAITNILLTILVYHASGGAWAGQLIFGGNLLLLASMFGWWIGSLGMPDYR